MKYKNTEHFEHGQAPRVGVLITNLGTPAAPTAQALRPYLKQFLSDPRVVELPRVLWWCILNGIILRTRPAKSAEAYATVWTEKGSPLALHTADQCDALADALTQQYGDKVCVRWAMRYGTPSIASTLDDMMASGVQKLFVLPLYPQYSATTTGSTFDALAADFTQRRWLPELRFHTEYHTHPLYIDALVNTIRAHWDAHGQQEHLVFSYHGVPLRYLHQGDPYHCQCLKTSRLVAQKLGLSPAQYTSSFQSRFGREPWLQPYTDETLKTLAAKGTHSVAVICPGFSSDCLETVEEIGEENREYFEEAGGETYHYIPALNASDDHIRLLTQLCQDNIDQWIEELPAADPTTASRYRQCPHNTPES